MKFFGILALSSVLALAAAAPQDTVEDSAEVKCVKACDGDACCVAACVGVPCPNEDMANQTTECAAQCDQGDGSPEDTAAYAKCQTDCINAEFWTTGSPSTPQATDAPQSTDSSDSETGSDSDSGSESGSGSDATGTGSAEETGSPTESGSGSATSTGAASNVQMGASAAGVFGILMAALAL